MAADLPAACTDALLAAAAATGAVVRGLRRQYWIAAGLGLIAIAATLGIGRFSGNDAFELPHTFAARLATVLGTPLMGLGWVLAATASWRIVEPERALRMGKIATASLLLGAAVGWNSPKYNTAIAGIGMVALAVCAGALARRSPRLGATGMFGAGTVLISGLLVSGEGDWAGISRLAWFHVGMAVALASIAVGGEPATPSQATTGLGGPG